MNQSTSPAVLFRLPVSLASSATAVLVTYATAHAAIDAATVTTLYRAGITSGLVDTFWLVVLYNALAFALQAAIGPLVDVLRAPRTAAIVGTALAFAALMLLDRVPASAVVVTAGIGNALFHLGGGAIALELAPGKSAPSGVFVAPGALGLAVGIWAGHRPSVPLVPIGAMLVFCLIAQMLIDSTSGARPTEPALAEKPDRAHISMSVAFAAAVLLLLTVGVRSLVGSGAAHALPRSVPLTFALALGAFSGKCLGGFVADRLGWIPVSVGALLMSLPFLVIYGDREWAVVIGVMFFQMTMPVTLAAMASLMPGRPATAFGVCCLALVIGTAVLWNPSVAAVLLRQRVFEALIILSAIGVWRALAVHKRLQVRAMTVH